MLISANIIFRLKTRGFSIFWNCKLLHPFRNEDLKKSKTIKNKRTYYILTIPLLLVLGIIYYSYNPENTGFFPQCPFKYFTGYSCPGCGSQRAIHEILHLNFSKAFEHNALLMLSIPYMLIGFSFNFDDVKNRFPRTRTFFFGQKAVFVIVAIVICFFIFRNF